MSEGAWLQRHGRRAVWIFGAAVGALLLAEVLRWRPAYGVGDESIQMRWMAEVLDGRPFAWRFLQGSLQRRVLLGWLELAGFGLGRLHVPGLLFFGLELAALWALARRWGGEAVAAGSVLFVLLSAGAWLRARSILSFGWQPFLLLALALAAARARRPWSAALAGLSGALLLLDYDGGALAVPFVLLLAAEREPHFRAQWRWAALGLALGTALVAWRQWDVLRGYVQLRAAVNVGASPAGLSAAWLANLRQLLLGGEPLGYLGLRHWPALAPWAWAALALGAVAAWREGWRSLPLWAGFIVALTQASLSPWGVSPQRLTGAWPAFALMAGLGLRRLDAALGPRARWALPLLLTLGFASECSAWFRHHALLGGSIYGRVTLMDRGLRDLDAEVRAEPAAIDAALMRLRYPELRWHLPPARPLPDGAPAWLLVPPEYRLLAESLGGRVRVWRDGLNAQPFMAVRVEGEAARRFAAMDAALAPLLEPGLSLEAASRRDRAWLQAPGRDAWAWWAVLERELGRLWEGGSMDAQLQGLFASQPAIQPGPDTLLGKYLIGRDPGKALRFLERALTLDPDYSPALEARIKACKALGRDADAQRAREERLERFRRGAWQVYD